jgi:hypothetical protein
MGHTTGPKEQEDYQGVIVGSGPGQEKRVPEASRERSAATGYDLVLGPQ